MTNTPAAPEDRYVVECHGTQGCEVHDRVLGTPVGRSGLTWGAAHSEAQRLNREARAANNSPPMGKQRPELDALLERSIAEFNALSPEEQAAMRKAQAESWVRGNLAIDRGPDARRAVSVRCPECARYRAALEDIGRTSGEREVLAAVNAVLGITGGEHA